MPLDTDGRASGLLAGHQCVSVLVYSADDTVIMTAAAAAIKIRIFGGENMG